jgi:Spy/CpxP family protein refolding chaperone
MGTLVVAAVLLGPATARGAAARSPQGPGEPGTPAGPAADREEAGEVRREMQRYFVTRLRAELGLTDPQMAALTPEIEALEQTRMRNARERRELGAALRRALDAGAGDEEIQAVLDRFDEASIRHETELRERLRKIDASLTVRQRAELRFFLTRFRQDMERRVRDFRSTGRRPSRR